MKLSPILALFIFIMLPRAAQAASDDSIFLARIHDAKMLVADRDPRTVEDISRDLQATSSPEGNLQIFEAVASTFRDLVIDGNIVDDNGKKDLYDQIRMNVAFIQFGGNPNLRNGKKIDRWIRQTLMKYLPGELMKNDDIFYSADEWKK